MTLRNVSRVLLSIVCGTVALLVPFGGASSSSESAQENANGVISTAIDVSPAAMLAPAGENWLSYHGDYSGRRFSNLEQITPANVSQLQAQWVFHVRDASDMEVTPVVVDGVMFVTAAERCLRARRTHGAHDLALLTSDNRRTHRRCFLPSQSRRRNLAIPHLSWKPTTLTCCAWTRVPGHLLWDVAVRGRKQELRRDQRASGGERQSHRRNIRRRRRRQRFCCRVRRANRKAGMAILDDSRAGRAWFGKLAGADVPARRRPRLGCPERTILNSIWCTGVQAIPRQTSTAARDLATTYTRTAFSRSIQIPES